MKNKYLEDLTIDEMIRNTTKLIAVTARYITYLISFSEDFTCLLYEVTDKIINREIIWDSIKSSDSLMFEVTDKMRDCIEEIKYLIDRTMSIPFFKGDLYKLKDVYDNVEFDNYVYDNIIIKNIGDFIND